MCYNYNIKGNKKFPLCRLKLNKENLIDTITHKSCKASNCARVGMINKSGNYYFPRGYCLYHYKKYIRNGTLRKQSESHNMTNTPLYKCWSSMINRCYNIKNPSYNNYGGRGIQVCKRWKNSFTNFYQDMGERPDGHSLDRIDNNGNYAPNNCRWATISQQQLNRRSVSANPGIYFKKRFNYYEVYKIGCSKKIYLGSRKNIHEAISLQQQKLHELYSSTNKNRGFPLLIR